MSRQSPNCELVIKWGNYKDRTIGDIPSRYLKWLAENAYDNKTRQAAEDEFNWRTDHGGHFEED